MAYTTIDDPSAYFQIATYTGDGNDDRAITNDGNSDLQPDWIWFKNRSTTNQHNFLDSSRGVTKRLRADDDSAEATVSTRLKSFDSDGMTISTDPSVNGSGNSIVAWQWKANGGTATATGSESGNNPAYSVQANTTAGFSIVTYTGTGAAGTVPHGLGAVPDVLFVKVRSTTDPWSVYHSGNTSAPETDYLVLDSAASTADHSNRWNDTAPTSSVFTVEASGTVNLDAGTFVAYCFTGIQGYSKFGSYTGNGNADGPFVYTGFKPAWVLTKGSDVGDDWVIIDNKRDPHNRASKRLFPNGNSAEDSTSNWMDFLSNGFKLGVNDTKYNGNGSTYIYMAFAEHPFVSSEGVPVTAR